MKNINQKMTLEDKVDGLVVTVEKLADIMKGSFVGLEKKIEEKFDGVGEEFVKVYERFDGIEATMRHNHVELGTRLTSVEKRTGALELKRS